jgi:hypothetical protein
MGKLFKLAFNQTSYNFPGSSAKNLHLGVNFWSVFTIDQFKWQKDIRGCIYNSFAGGIIIQV